MHEYFSGEKFLCSSLKKIIIGLPHLFSKLLRKAFLKDYFDFVIYLLYFTYVIT